VSRRKHTKPIGASIKETNKRTSRETYSPASWLCLIWWEPQVILNTGLHTTKPATDTTAYSDLPVHAVIARAPTGIIGAELLAELLTAEQVIGLTLRHSDEFGCV